MKKFIIVSLMAGFLTAQAPVNALKQANHSALAQAAAAQKVAATNGNLGALKKVCAKTSALRKLVYGAVTTAGIAGLTYLAFTLGFTPEYLMSLIDPAVCQEGFMNVGNTCVEMLPTDMPTVLVNCQEGFMNVANTCVEACKGMPSTLNGVVGVMTNGVYNAATGTCSYVWNSVNFVANNPLECAEGFIENTGTCVEVAKPVVETVTETLKAGFLGAFGYNQ